MGKDYIINIRLPDTIPILVKAIQTQNEMIKSLQLEIQMLKQKIL